MPPARVSPAMFLGMELGDAGGSQGGRFSAGERAIPVIGTPIAIREKLDCGPNSSLVKSQLKRLPSWRRMSE